MKTNFEGLIVTESRESLQTWVSRPYVTEKLREQLRRANVLVVPSEGYADREEIVYFPAGTVEVVRFLKESGAENLVVDVCIEDEAYREVAQHADLLTIAGLVVTLFVAPLTVELLAAYIVQRIGQRKTIVRSVVTVHDELKGRSISFSYEGPAEEYREVMMKAIDSLVNFQERPILDTEAKKKTGAQRKKKHNKHKKG